MVRQPAVAGQFYPARPNDLRTEIARHIVPHIERIEAYGMLAPHAGYMYSGHVAGLTYSSLMLPKTLVLLCPNHTGYGAPVAIMTKEAWRTPLGLATINSELALSIMRRSMRFEEDSLAHRYEHALEVHLPFLQYLLSEFSFVPINVGIDDLSGLKEIGRAVAEAVSEFQDKVLLIASSDMTHYESAESARRKDHMAIEAILSLSPDDLYSVVRRERISMCGYAPSVSLLEACKRLGATSATLVAYAHSGEVNKDYDRVVGYAGILVH